MGVVRNALLAGAAFIALAVGRADAADAPAMPTKAAPPLPAYDWTGAYVGGHFGYAAGHADWSATEAGMATPGLTGTLDFFKPYDFFTGTGSNFWGFQAGYNHMFRSRVVIGIETDVSLPSSVLEETIVKLPSSQTISSASIGQARYAETVELSGTLRGRIGYAPGNWLFYATGGFAWTYDQFIRTQLAGTPAGGTAVPGTVEALLMVPRAGWTAGAGVEVALPSHWTARLEYLFTDFGPRSVTFAAGAQQFSSDLALQSIRLGLNYRIGSNATPADFLTTAPAALETDKFAIHGQTTYLNQYAFPFRTPYHGQNSLDSNAGRETWDATLYGGVRLWQGAELWVNPEIDQGFGLSNTLGVAGFPSGEAYKVGFSVPYARLPRMFIRQTIDLGGETQKLESGANQFSGSQTADRLVITVGKFAVTDIFDTNKYAHDPRNDFMNWALVDTGTFDYAADAWGYTYGGAVEWYRGPWTLRGGLFDLSIVPNSTDLDPQFHQFQWVGEIERRYDLWGQPGKIAVTGFFTRGRMGSFEDAIQLAASTGGPADIAAVRRYASRGGISANMEQQITPEIGAFARAGWADGNNEPYEFTDVDRTVAGGLSVSGKLWGRTDDTWGIAGVVNGISGVHQAFLNAGGIGILVGDGQLPNPGLEQILETYYGFPLGSLRATLDYQFIVNPAYNRDRGPVSVIGARVHTQF
jgi:high affinity Mn2+ porin